MSFPEDKHLPQSEEPTGESTPASTTPHEALQPGAEPNGGPDESPSLRLTEPEFGFARLEDEAETLRRLQDIEFTPDALRRPEDRAPLPETPRRRRRSNRLIRRPAASELGDKLESLARRSTPTIDFFIFAFLSGCILAVGYILNAPAILLLGVIVAPLMAPWVGAMLAASTGETRFLRQTFGAFLTVLGVIFLIGLLGGFASRLFQPMDSGQALAHARLWWYDLLLLILGVIVLVIAFIQSSDKPILASLMVAYEFFLPVSAAGFGLGSGIEGLWPQAGLVFLVHLALSILVSLMVFFYMGFRPVETTGYVVAGTVLVLSLAFVGGFFGLSPILNTPPEVVEATPTPSATPTLTFLPSPSLPPTKLATITPLPPTEPATITPQAPEAASPEPALTPLPTPVYGRIQAEGDGNGVLIRAAPAGTAITTIQNGYLVEFLPVDPVMLDNETWVNVLVRIPSGDIEGWILLRFIQTATPFGSP